MADLKIAGKIIQVLPLAQGIGKATGKEWKKQDYVLETINDNFPKKVSFGLFNDKIQQYPMKVGDIVTISFDVEAREYNGRWYNDLRVWKVDQGDTTMAAGQQAFQQQPADNFPPATPQPQQPTSAGAGMADPFASQGSDDLPF
jgi:hypothetical protein